MSILFSFLCMGIILSCGSISCALEQCMCVCLYFKLISNITFTILTRMNLIQRLCDWRCRRGKNPNTTTRRDESVSRPDRSVTRRVTVVAFLRAAVSLVSDSLEWRSPYRRSTWISFWTFSSSHPRHPSRRLPENRTPSGDAQIETWC